jgi:hypothetical protein
MLDPLWAKMIPQPVSAIFFGSTPSFLHRMFTSDQLKRVLRCCSSEVSRASEVDTLRPFGENGLMGIL